MSDYHVYIPYLNRPDLLKRAVDSVPELWPNLTIIDNSSEQDVIDDTFHTPSMQGNIGLSIFRPNVPFSFTMSQNWFFYDAKRRGCKFMMWFHNDCQLPSGAVQQMIDRVRGYYAEGRKWGVAFSYYDIFSAVNLAMVDEVGGYDTNIFSYVGDQDYYLRVKLAGWELVNTEIEVEAIRSGHVGSQTINSDERIRLINGVTQTMANFYFSEKWGGEPGKEKFTTPWNRPDLFGGK